MHEIIAKDKNAFKIPDWTTVIWMRLNMEPIKKSESVYDVHFFFLKVDYQSNKKLLKQRSL